MKMSKKKTFILLIICLILNFSYVSLIREKQNKIINKISLMDETIKINIKSDKEQLEDGSYLIGSVLTFEVENKGYNTVNIILLGQNSGRLFNLTLKKCLDYFVIKWDTNDPNPIAEDKPADPDTYKITLKIDGNEKDSDPSEITLATSQEEFPLWLIIIIIIGIIATVLISSLFVIKRKRAAKAEDLEFKAVDKTVKKKKGKIYSGASLIGKRDGAIAELKTKSKISTESTSKTKPKRKSQEIGSKPRENIMMPPLSSTNLFNSSPSSQLKSVAMIKTMEERLDFENKIKFQIAHIDSILQNIEFFKSILQTHPQTELYCPDCKRKVSKYWITCPYCEISEQDAELSLKQSMLAIKEDIKFCPDCKRIIKQNWIICPFCFVKKNT